MPQPHTDHAQAYRRAARGWTPQQRTVLMVLVASLLVYAGVLAFRDRLFISNPPPDEGARAHLLLTGLDPNEAPAHELAMIPFIGPSRAREIVAYRQRILEGDPKAVPFAQPEDLMRVRGIGRALVNHMRPHLRFPPPRHSPHEPSTQPSAVDTRNSLTASESASP